MKLSLFVHVEKLPTGDMPDVDEITKELQKLVKEKHLTLKIYYTNLEKIQNKTLKALDKT